MSKVKNLLSVLEPIEEDITLLGGEKFSTGIVVLPVLTKLNKRLAPDEKYPIYIVKLKKLRDVQQRAKGTSFCK